MLAQGIGAYSGLPMNAFKHSCVCVCVCHMWSVVIHYPLCGHMGCTCGGFKVDLQFLLGYILCGIDQARGTSESPATG